MPSTYSTSLRLEKMATGEKTNTWGDIANLNMIDLMESAVAGVASVTHDDSASYTMTASNGADDEARHAVIEVGGTLTAARNLVCPTAQKVYAVSNATSGGFAITVKTAAGTGISVPNGSKKLVYCDGTNVVDLINDLPSGTTVGGTAVSTSSTTETLTNKTIDGDNNTISNLAHGAEVDNPSSGVHGVTGSVVGTTDTQTLTNKTLTTPIISSISNTGTLTLPTSTDTLVGRATTDTLSNKTVDNINVQDDIIHDGDTDNLISFGTDTQSYETGGSSRLDISNTGVRMGGANARVTTILDEDSMASDSATALATQQSIKAYVDAAGGGGFDTQLFHVQDQKASGSQGGTFTSGAWQTRDLNTSVTNEISGASLATNQITLPAGTYWIEADAPAQACGANKLRLRNITDGTTALVGMNVSAQNTNSWGATLTGRFTIAGSKAFELQHQCAVTRATDGFGDACSFSVTEIYADVRIWKI